MSTEATPAVPEGGTTPAAPAATPSTPPATTVTLSKEEHDQLARDAARARENQRKASLYDRMTSGGGSQFSKRAPAAPAQLSDEEIAERGRQEDAKAERGLMRLAADPAFREVLDADPTLKNLLVENPLAVLPMLAPDALDADDAIGLVKEALNGRKKPATTPASPAAPAPATPAAPATPPAGGVNPKDSPVNEDVEAARKLPNTEKAVAGMIGARLKRGAGNQ